MKLKFKQQQYQRDATMAVVNCFGGQNKGERKEIIGRTRLFVDEIFSNKKIELAEEEIFKMKWTPRASCRNNTNRQSSAA